jgi:hypothetical protein
MKNKRNTKIKEQENEHNIHTNVHKMYPRNPEMGENPTRR